jgi:hypothetical protein
MGNLSKTLTHNPALDCGINPNDGLLVAYLPKLDTVLREHHLGDETAHSVDGVMLDVVAPKPVKWWKVRRAAGELGMALPEVVWQGRAGDFSVDEGSTFASFFSPDRFRESAKLYMRAYSHGPWICVEPEQLEKVYDGDSA